MDVLLHALSVVKTVGKSSSGGLVDDTESIEEHTPEAALEESHVRIAFTPKES